MNKVTAFAPATVANFVCGYDILGFAIDGIGDEVTVSFNNTAAHSFELLEGPDELREVAPEKNVAFAMMNSLSEAIGNKKGIHVQLKKNMPLNSGLGSSSASTVAALVATNMLFGNPYPKEELLPFAMQGEAIACGKAHADNVAPCLFGGISLVKSYDPLMVVSLPVPPRWVATVVHPHVDVPTREARRILKSKVALSDAVTQFGNIAGLICGIYEDNDQLVGASMEDVIIEPHRAILIPYFYEMKIKAMELGAIGFGISGSGPSVFALSPNVETATRIGEQLKLLLNLHQVENDLFISSISTQGARVIL